MRTHACSRLSIALLSLSAFGFAAPQARAVILPPDFTLGPSTLTVGVEGDSTEDGGCNGTTNDGCDSYKFKVPITVDPNSDIGDDLALPGEVLAVFLGHTPSCPGTVDFEVDIPHSALIIKKTRGEETVRFHGMAENGPTHMVPVNVLIQVHRHTGKGFFMASGLADLTALHGLTSAFVGLSVTADSDSDEDRVCTPVTQKNTSQN